MANSSTISRLGITGKNIGDSQGPESETTMHYKECTIFSKESCIDLNNSWLINTNVSGSNLHLTNGSIANIIGSRILLHGVGFRYILHEGSDNTIILKNVQNFVWSGSNGQCNMESSTDTCVYGHDNKVLGEGNIKLLVCGHQNSIIANQNDTLKVRGHCNYVSAWRTSYVTIDGMDNHVSVSDISIRHTLSKAEPGLVTGFSFEIFPENHIDFCGIPTGSSVYAEILCPQIPLATATMESYLPYQSFNCHSSCDKLICGNEKTTLIPQVRIRYVDQAIIRRYTYNLGIFQVDLEGISYLHNLNSPIKVKVIPDNLDRGSFNFHLAPNRKMLMCFGSKGGLSQNLKITGNRIVENYDLTFFVYFEKQETT